MFGQQVSAPVEVTLHAAGLDDEMVSNESNEVDQMPHLWMREDFLLSAMSASALSVMHKIMHPAHV